MTRVIKLETKVQKKINLLRSLAILLALIPITLRAQVLPPNTTVNANAANSANSAASALINSLPNLPKVSPANNATEKKIDVSKPAAIGVGASAATIRLSGFESDIENDVAGYKIVAKYFPLQLTQEDWKRISAEIWEAYRDLGRLVRVDLVADRDDFIVSIVQLRIRKITVSGTPDMSAQELKKIDAVARQYMTEGQIADLFQLKQFLLHMDYRAKETITTQVASNDGEAVDINFSVVRRDKKLGVLKPFQVGVDDYGTGGFGRTRWTARYSAPLLSAGDNLAVQTLLANGQEFASLRYDMPLGYLPLRASLWTSLLHYNVNTSLPQYGNALMAGADLSYPFFFREGGLITTSLGYEHKQTRDSVFLARKWFNNLHVRAAGENFLQGRLSFSGDVTVGNLSIGEGVMLSLDRLWAQSNGGFQKLYADAQFSQVVTPNSFFTVSLKGQIANKNLDALEKFSFGGIMGVRAYSSDLGTGDEGVLANLSYTFRPSATLPIRVGVFYDYAQVRASHASLPSTDPSAQNNFQMDAAGLQLVAQYKQFMLNTALAHPISKSFVNPQQGWRMWAQLTAVF